MADEIIVYNLQDNGTPVESSSSDVAPPTLTQGVAMAESTAPAGSPASPITEGDVRVLIKQELEHWSGDIRIGSMLSGQVFILDSRGLMMGSTEFSTAPFSVTYDGSIVGTSGSFGSWVVTADTLYSLASGTPTATPNDGIVLDSSNPVITVYEDTAKRIELGYLSAGIFGLKGYATDGTTTVFEVSDTQQILGGWNFTDTLLRSGSTDALSNVLIDSGNSLMRLGPTATAYITMDGANKRIRSSDYVSGIAGAGFTLEPDLLEVGNISARGIIRTAVFQKNVISAVGGSFAVVDSDKLNADMTALDASTLTISGNTTFAVGDLLRIKDGIDDEWLEVTNIGSAPTYTVTRDKASAYSANTNPTWQNGATVVNYRASGNGLVYMTASDTNAPYIAVQTHAGSPWSALTTRARLGNLNGYLGYVADTYGLGVGSNGAGEANITIDPINGIRVRTGTTSLFSVDMVGGALIADWNITTGYLYGLSSGTPTATPNDGIVLKSGATGGVIVYEDTAKRVEMGYLSAGIYGLKAYATNGTTVIFEASDAQQIMGGFTFSDTQFYNSTNIVLDASAKSISIKDSTFGNNGIQLQYNAGDPRAYIGDGASNFMQFDGTQFSASGSLIAQQSYTSGQIMDTGSVGAIESDGLLYRTRWTNVSSRGTPVQLTNATDSESCLSKFLSISSTVKALFFNYDGASSTTSTFRVAKIVVSPTSSSITSDTEYAINTTGIAYSNDAVLMTDTTALAVWTNAVATKTLYCRMVTDLGGTPTMNTIASYTTNVDENQICVVQVSATEALIFFRDTSSDILAIPVTISGTTCTFGSPQTVITHASNNYYPIFVEKFVGSDNYCLAYSDITNSDGYLVNINYSSGVVTVGTPLNFVADIGTTGNPDLRLKCYMAQVSATVMCVALRKTVASTTNEVQVISLSGSTLTTSSTLSGLTTTSDGTVRFDRMISITRLGTYTYACVFCSATATSNLWLLDLAGTTLTQIGSTYTLTSNTSNRPNLVIYESPTKAVFYCGDSSTYNTSILDFSTNYSGTLGVITAGVATSASVITVLSGENTSVSGLTTGTEYYADLDGALTTAVAGGTKKIGVATSATKLVVQV